MRAIAAFLALIASAAAAETPTPVDPEERLLKQAEAVEQQLVRVVEAVRPSSVTVFNSVKREGAYVVSGCGSGVIIRSSGLILTNEHVIKGADRLEVALLDGRRLPAEIESRVAEYDIALIRVTDGKGKAPAGLKPAPFGKSASLKDGDWVIATGNPFFLASSGRPVVTLGIVSGLNRVMGGEFFYGNAIQHDAEINPGNSGGPLWDTEGRFMGINGKIASRSGMGPSNSGVGFTIPVDQVENFMKQLLNDDAARVGAGDLGITVETARDEKGRETGAKITVVKAASPAATNRTGALLVGDVIECITIKSKAVNIHNATEYINTMSVWPQGTRVDGIQVRRAGRLKILSGFELAAAAPEPPKPKGPGR